MFSKSAFLLLSLTAITVVGSAISAQAEVTNSTEFLQSSESVTPLAKAESDLTPISQLNSVTVDVKEKSNQKAQATVSDVQQAKTKTIDENQLATTTEVPNSEPIAKTTTMLEVTDTSSPVNDAVKIQPIPGKMVTSAAALKTEFTTSPPPQITPTTQAEIIPKTQDSKIAQNEVIPGRVTRSGPSYIGIAGNLGLGGNSALGDGSFAVISKVGLTRTLSVRPSVLINKNTTFLIPVTYDFSLERGNAPLEPARFAPYLGAGISIGTGNNNNSSDVGFLVTGGVDVPLTSQFTATGSINAAFKDQTDVGLIIGVGYNFRGI